MLSAMRSKDPNTQVGACIVNFDKKIVGIGYNGFPRGISDDIFPWEKQGLYSDTKYPYVVHAEANAILNSTTSLKNTTLYVTLFPCSSCMKLIIQSGITKIIYNSNKYKDTEDNIASIKMAKHTNVLLEEFSDEKVIK